MAIKRNTHEQISAIRVNTIEMYEIPALKKLLVEERGAGDRGI